MKKKNYFFGKYYKFISDSQESFAMIVAESNEGKSIQLITATASYQIHDTEAIQIKEDYHFLFSVHQEDLTLEGELHLGDLHPLSKKVMGPFTYVPFLECRHAIYSMFHDVHGELKLNGRMILFQDGIGYIEGDRGKNFPKKYIWYNSVLKDQALTLAIASIPLGPFSFTGVLCFLKTNHQEYYFCTWNRIKIKELTQGHIQLKKGHYRLTIDIALAEGHQLKAPVQGTMVRYIKENLSVSSHYCLQKKDQCILEAEDLLSSCEWVY